MIYVPCKMCGTATAPDTTFLCGGCWGTVPGELKDRVDEARHQTGSAFSLRFQNAVAQCVRFLQWQSGMFEDQA